MSPKRYRFDRDVGGGRCAVCRGRILRDSNVVWIKGSDRLTYVHWQCAQKVVATGAEGLECGGERLVGKQDHA